MTDIDYMKHALALAVKAKTTASPNPMVGSIIVRGNRLIAEGWHRRCGTAHAEVVALQKAGHQAKGAKLYVTLEPCFHYGRTPPCVDQIIQTGIKAVIIAMKDPNPLTHGKSIAKLKKAGIKVKVGILRREAERLNEAYIKYVTEGTPFVVGKCAQSLDGKIATAQGQSQWITSEPTRQYARKIRDEFDAILVGINTVLKDNPQLTGHSKQLKKIVLDSTLKISLKAKLFEGTAEGQCSVAVTSKASERKINLLEKRGVQVIMCPQKNGKINLKWLLKYLAKQEIMSILIEGGARVMGTALKEKVIDKMYMYIAPKIMGDQNALSSVAGIKINHVNKSILLKNIELDKIGEDILVVGNIKG